MTREEAGLYIIRHCNPDYPKGKTEWEQAINLAIKALEKPEPKKGKWYEHYSHEDGERDGVRCSECGTHYYFDGQLMNFCPSCGADMRGEADG